MSLKFSFDASKFTKKTTGHKPSGYGKYCRKKVPVEKPEEITLDCISALPVHPFVDSFVDAVNATKTGNANPIVVGAATGAGKTVGLGIGLMLNAKTSGHKVYFALPTRAAVISAKESLTHFTGSYATDAERRYFGFAQNREVDYKDYTLVKYGTTRHIINVMIRLLADKKKHRSFKNMVLVIDEAHYQNADTRVLLLLAGHIFKMMGGHFCPVIASATLDNAPIEDIFEEATKMLRIEVPGRLFPIKTVYGKKDFTVHESAQLLTATTRRIAEIAQYGAKGSILVFLSGEGEINNVFRILTDSRVRATILRAYGQMNTEEYEELFKEHSGRVIILATNVAETSVTIPNVTHVVDTLRQKTVYEVGQGKKICEELCSLPASIQRRGRAGRLCHGTYHPMATEDGIAHLSKRDKNELERMHPDDFILMFLRYNLNVDQIKSILKLSDDYMRDRLDYLVGMGTVEIKEDSHTISKKGMRIIDLPTTIECSLALFESEKYNETTQIFTCLLIAMVTAVSGGTLTWVPHKLSRYEKDMYHREMFGRFLGRTDVETNFKYFLSMYYESDNYLDWAKNNSFNNKLMRQARKIFVTLCKAIVDAKISDLKSAFDKVDWKEVGFSPEDLPTTVVKRAEVSDFSVVDFHPTLMKNMASAVKEGFYQEVYTYCGGSFLKNDIVHKQDTRRSHCWGFSSAPYRFDRRYRLDYDEEETHVYSEDVPRRYNTIRSREVVCINNMTIVTYPRGMRSELHTVSWILPLDE